MTTQTLTSTDHNKVAHYSLWAVQVLLGAAFLLAGFAKLSTPINDLAKQMAWVSAVPEGLVRFIGTAEFLGALGLILPAATRILPFLTSTAAAGLTLVMTLAMLFHVSRGELSAVPINLVLGGLSAFVAWGRAKKAVITAR